MPLAVLVEGLEANPTVLLSPVSLKDEDLPAQLDAAIDAHNAGNVLSKATGALVWYDDKPNQTFEYFAKERAVGGCVVQDRGPSQTYRLQRLVGRGIIAPPRNNSAHPHRPWRAS